VLVGTGGPKQTVVGTGHIDGPLRVVPSEQKIPGVSQQTVYTPSGGVTVLVGTGNITLFELYSFFAIFEIFKMDQLKPYTILHIPILSILVLVIRNQIIMKVMTLIIFLPMIRINMEKEGISPVI
jgi:hypothetical protein